VVWRHATNREAENCTSTRFCSFSNQPSLPHLAPAQPVRHNDALCRYNIFNFSPCSLPMRCLNQEGEPANEVRRGEVSGPPERKFLLISLFSSSRAVATPCSYSSLVISSTSFCGVPSSAASLGQQKCFDADCGFDKNLTFFQGAPAPPFRKNEKSLSLCTFHFFLLRNGFSSSGGSWEGTIR